MNGSHSKARGEGFLDLMSSIGHGVGSDSFQSASGRAPDVSGSLRDVFDRLGVCLKEGLSYILKTEMIAAYEGLDWYVRRLLCSFFSIKKI